MSGPKKPSPLASFSDTWVGGDIHGLSAFAATMYGYVSEFQGVTEALDTTVKQIVTDAGWSGDAASAFATAWERDSRGVQALGAVASNIGDTVNTLAVNLANFESALEQAADWARAQGVKIGPDGQPPVPVDGPPATKQQADAESALNWYIAFHRKSMAGAQSARDDATTALHSAGQQIAPPSPGDPVKKIGDTTTLADYLRSLYGVPSAYRSYVSDKLATASKVFDEAQAAWQIARDSRPNPNLPMPNDVKAARSAAMKDLKAAQQELADAEAAEARVPLSKLLSASMSDVVPALARQGDDLSFIDRLVKIGGDIPVIDVAAAVVGTAVSSYEDIKEGKPWYEAIPEEALANGAGVYLGSVASTLLVAGGVAIGAPAAGVVAAAVIGGVVALGVGDVIDEGFKENWGADIQQHGVAMGLLGGAGDTLKNSWSDMVNTPANLWHSITSL